MSLKRFLPGGDKAKRALAKELQPQPRYQNHGLLGQGGMGKIERCFDRSLHRAVATKSLRDELKESLPSIQQLLHEARLISYLQHPGIVSVHDAFTDKDLSPSYTMQLIEGEALQGLLARAYQREDFLSVSHCLSIFTKICETMAYVHDKGVLHLDLKPENIMIGAYGEVLIVDWGTARLYEPSHYRAYLQQYGMEEKLEYWLNGSDVIAGTPPFMSPDQFLLSSQELGPGSDIFSLGVMLYLMLTHKVPFPYEGDIAKFFKSLKEDTPKMLHEVRGDVPRQISSLCARMLAKQPEERYQNINDVLRDLQSLTDSGSTFETRRYKHGEIIFEEGDPGDYAFLILAGYVEIYREVDGERKFLATRGEGEIIGELAVFTNEPRTASIKAIVPTTIKILNQEVIEEEFGKLSPWVGKMIEGLSQRFAELSDQLARKP